MRTRVKFCGVVRPEDAAAAVMLGADAVGAILYPDAPAAVSPAEAAAIFRAAPPPTATVAVFVNAAPSFVAEVVKRARPSILQFHGDEDAAYCASFDMPYIKACRIAAAEDAAAAAREYPDAAGILLDSKVRGKYGGTGEPFDWNCIPANSAAPLFVAGGLTAATVGKLIAAHRPRAVDVSGGIAADGDKRRKDFDKMRAFLREVMNADHRKN
ncbi:MAG: phosphoribosylanthranilate isomerase [Gammaproteobacteria bacterium]